MISPITGITYSLEQILTKLNLLDSPCFLINHNDKWIPIQEAHITNEQFLSIEGLKTSRWAYARTTHEWIPIFYCKEIDMNLLTIEDDVDERGNYWVVPKAFPRKQYKMEI